ncbi:hypothetical protein Tco_0747099 [Tanacetum coccineum]
MKSIREKANQIFPMAQQIVPADQLVSKFQSIRRCNNYAMLQIVNKVPETKDTIRFKLNTQEITCTVDMFHDTLKLPVETPNNPFITPVIIETIESFMQTVGYQGVVDKLFHVVVDRTNVDYAALLWWDFMNNVFQKKNVIQYPRFIKLIIAVLMEKYPSIPRRHDEDYHSIKDDTPLVSVYSVGNVLFRGMRIPDAFLTAKIHATDDYKEYETVFVRVDVPMNQPQPVVSTQGTHRNTPRAHKTPTLTAASPQGKKRKKRVGETSSPRKLLKVTIRQKKQSTPSIPPPAAEAQENIAKVQEKLDEEEIERMVKGGEDEESYASEFTDSMLNDDVDDSGTRIEPMSHKEHPENVNDDDEEIETEKKDDDVEKTDKVVKEKDNDEVALGSMEFRNEKMQTPISTPTRSPRKDLSSDKTISKELTATVSPTTTTTSKDSSIPKSKKGFFYTRRRFFQEIREVLDHCNNVVPELTFAKTNDMINKEMPCLVNLAVNKDREVDPINAQEMISKEFATHGPKMIEELFRKHMQNTTLNLYPTTSSSTADLQQQLYLNMKTKPQDQAADPELWEILKAKFEKP